MPSFVSGQSRPGASRYLPRQQRLGHTGRTLQLADGAMAKGKGSERAAYTKGVWCQKPCQSLVNPPHTWS